MHKTNNTRYLNDDSRPILKQQQNSKTTHRKIRNPKSFMHRFQFFFCKKKEKKEFQRVTCSLCPET